MNNRNKSRINRRKKRIKKIKILCLLGTSCISMLLLCGMISKDKFLNKYEENVLDKPHNGNTQISTLEQSNQISKKNSSEDSNDNGKKDANKASSKGSSCIPDKSDWKLILVNADNKLPDNFSVDLTKLKDGQSIDKRAYDDLQNMIDDMHSIGLSPKICSSYRTQQKQEYLFNNEVKECLANGSSKENAKRDALKWVAAPGTSEHQTGLALDIVATSYQILDKKQETTAEQKWLIKNSYKYGFILRYPSNKSNITGIGYEPWHYRYVGKDAAKQIYENGICLEEYLNEIN